MAVIIRKAVDADLEVFISFTVALSMFNRAHHADECKYDDERTVYDAIAKSSKAFFEARDESSLILIAESETIQVGYAMGKILIQDPRADNGTGRYGLIDDLFVMEEARGMGLGKKLMEELHTWFTQNDIHRVKLHAYAWNQDAIKLYERNGFTPYVISLEKFI
ncbi:MAG: N-acetyltransferase family protein [Erysipelotrichaceae bacterium]